MEAGTKGMTREAGKRRRRTLHSVLRLLLGVVLLFLLTLLIDAEEILRAFESANGLLIIPGAALVLLNLGFQTWKWNVLLKLLLPSISWRETIASFMFGMTLGALTPGQIGEFGGRAFRIPSDRPGSIVGLAILDKLQVFGVMTIFGIWSLGFLYDTVEGTMLLLFGAFTVLPLLFLFRPILLRRLLELIGLTRLKHRWIAQILDSVSYVQSPRVIVSTLILTLCFYGTVFVQLFLLINAFSDVGWLDSFAGYSSMMFVKSLLPITIADLGTREAGLVYFLSLRGVPGPTAFNASLLLFFINFLIPALVGLLFLPRSFPPEEKQ